MAKTKLTIFSFLVIPSTFAGFRLTAQPAKLDASAEQIAPYEAEILVYLLPQAQELRKQGMDVGWEIQTSPKLNQRDFYTYWVFNLKRQNVEGSVTIGYFSVNKHTAEVWDNGNEKVVAAEDLEGVERILRRAHQINQETLDKFNSLRP
ncbi:MAG: hypothetical protein WBY73_21500 [Candidatus Acidiferrales bacterium]